MERCHKKEQERSLQWGVLRLEVSKRRQTAESQDDTKAWILRRREVDEERMRFWDDYAHELECAKVEFAQAVAGIRDSFDPEVVDLVKFADWVEDIEQWYEDKKHKVIAEADADIARAKAEREHEAASQGMAASQVTVLLARPRYSRFFNEAAGRPLEGGPPGATCNQPPALPTDMGNDELVQYWLDLGGYSSCCQMDTNGWTPLHHCIEAMVHWDQAWKIGAALIETMAASHDGEKWLRAKTQKGQPSHRTALHMLSCNSDRALRKAELAFLLAGKAKEVDPVDDQGRTPLMHAVGTGLLDVAKALVEAGADPHKKSHDGRNIANRCPGSSGTVSKWVREELRVKAADVQVASRYRRSDAISLSRQCRYHAQAAMDEAEAASQGRPPASSSSASQGRAPGAAASSGGAPVVKAMATPINPSSARPSRRWAWFYDERRKKWTWHWLE